MEEMIPTEEAVADNVGIIYIIVGCSLGLVIIVAALASAAYVRTKKGRITAESNGFLHVYVFPLSPLLYFILFKSNGCNSKVRVILSAGLSVTLSSISLIGKLCNYPIVLDESGKSRPCLRPS